MMFLAMCIMLRVANKSFSAVVHWSGVLDQIMVPGLVTAQFELFLYCQRYTLMKGLIIDLCCWCSFYAGPQIMGIGQLEARLEVFVLEVFVLTTTPTVVLEMYA